MMEDCLIIRLHIVVAGNKSVHKNSSLSLHFNKGDISFNLVTIRDSYVCYCL